MQKKAQRIFQRNIYQVWFQGCDNIQRDDFKANVRKWKDLNEDSWNYFCVADRDLKNACAEFSQRCLQAYLSCPDMHMKIDLGRYVLLYLHGGVYVDMDAFALRKLDDSNLVRKLIESYETSDQHVLGLSQLVMHPTECLLTLGYTSAFNNAIMMSSKRNPVLKDFICVVVDNILAKLPASKFIRIQTTTGPVCFNRFFQNPSNTKQTRIIKFPPEIFEPCKLDGTCHITPNTIAVHKFELSWQGPVMKYIGQCYHTVRSYALLVIICLAALVFFFFLKC
jgi:mannosyltransferase OCH1-like enzyme